MEKTQEPEPNEEELNKHLHTLIDRAQQVIGGYIAEHDLEKQFSSSELSMLLFYVLAGQLEILCCPMQFFEGRPQVEQFLDLLKKEVLDDLDTNHQECMHGYEQEQTGQEHQE